MKTLVNLLTRLYLPACLVVVCILTIKLIDEISSPNIVQIGPHDIYSVMPDGSITGTDNTPVSFKGYCNFVLINTDTQEIIPPEIIPAGVGEVENSYVVDNIILLDSHYSVRLCGAEVYSEKDTTVIITIDPITKLVSIFVTVLVFLCLAIFIFWTGSRLIS